MGKVHAEERNILWVRTTWNSFVLTRQALRQHFSKKLNFQLTPEFWDTIPRNRHGQNLLCLFPSRLEDHSLLYCLALFRYASPENTARSWGVFCPCPQRHSCHLPEWLIISQRRAVQNNFHDSVLSPSTLSSPLVLVSGQNPPPHAQFLGFPHSSRREAPCWARQEQPQMQTRVQMQNPHILHATSCSWFGAQSMIFL